MRPEQPLSDMSEEGRVSWRRRGECCAAFIPAMTTKMGAEVGNVSGEDGGDDTGSSSLPVGPWLHGGRCVCQRMSSLLEQMSFNFTGNVIKGLHERFRICRRQNVLSV